MGEQIRTFIAVELGEAQRRALDQVQARLKTSPAARQVRWVAPTGIHLTLKFLGDVAADRLPDLERAVAGACKGIPPFDLNLAGTGAFPNLRRPNVIWVGLAGDLETMTRLAEAIDRVCAGLGFARESRAFSPHLTLGRVKRDTRPGDAQAIGEMMAQAATGDLGPFRVERVSIMKSDLRSTGSVYTELYAVEL